MSIKKDERLRDMLELNQGMSRVDQIKASFVKAKKFTPHNLRHPTNPDLKAVEIFPIFPDFEFWANEYLFASYEQEPAESTAQAEGAILKVTSRESLAYYAPTEETVAKLEKKRKIIEEFGEDEDTLGDYHYTYKRELVPKRDSEKVYKFFLEIRPEDGGAFYNPIKNRMVLKRSRHKNALAVPHIVVNQRPFTSEENKERQAARSEIDDAPLSD